MTISEEKIKIQSSDNANNVNDEYVEIEVLATNYNYNNTNPFNSYSCEFETICIKKSIVDIIYKIAPNKPKILGNSGNGYIELIPNIDYCAIEYEAHTILVRLSYEKAKKIFAKI